jgi:hypothetical protein
LRIRFQEGGKPLLVRSACHPIASRIPNENSVRRGALPDLAMTTPETSPVTVADAGDAPSRLVAFVLTSTRSPLRRRNPSSLMQEISYLLISFGSAQSVEDLR